MSKNVKYQMRAEAQSNGATGNTGRYQVRQTESVNLLREKREGQRKAAKQNPVAEKTAIMPEAVRGVIILKMNGIRQNMVHKEMLELHLLSAGKVKNTV